MIILHYILKPHLIRTHLPFEFIINNDVINHYLIPSNVNVKITSLIKNKENIHIVKNTVSLAKFNKKILLMISNVNPDIIIISDRTIESNFYIETAKWKKYLIHHGIWCQGILNKFKSKAVGMNFLNHFDKIFLTQHEINSLLHNTNNIHFSGINLLNIFTPVKGFYGFDYINHVSKTHVKTNINGNKNILIIVNKSKFDKNLHYNINLTNKEYITILNTVIKVIDTHPINIYVKMKHNGCVESSTRNNKSHTHKNVHIINSNNVVYPHLLNADIVIIQGYSTCFYESLYLNKPTIVCQFPKNLDHLDIDNLPLLGQKLQSYTPTQLYDNIIELLNNPITSDYIKECQLYLKTKIGTPFESIVDKIINTYHKKL